MSKVKLDLNNPTFLDEFFSLEKVEYFALKGTFRLIRQLEWEQLYTIDGLNWEKIESKTTTKGHNLYSFRFSNKYRATAYRDDDYLVMVNLHVDHDSAYKKK